MVVGRSDIVGKPMAMLLLLENATVTVCHSRTRDLPGVCRTADILVAAIGRPAMITAGYITPGAVVIDVGMNKVESRAEAERIFDPARLSRTSIGGGASLWATFIRATWRARHRHTRLFRGEWGR